MWAEHVCVGGGAHPILLYFYHILLIFSRHLEVKGKFCNSMLHLASFSG